ncbi:vacuolar protein sorting-associated protein 64 [Blumeria hordei DH14]|uniref:Vacuolar protein sorting-associated protein 64 n=1 Tax=Blumeria graminis f. sp. hordei (strain DH14) TaxID=546991 RepID=N1JHW4_BLUG1|nr:vacuolar protein sorting-associated protein 64 [Blumeria hordei DH14]
MTAVATSPIFQQGNRSKWSVSSAKVSHNAMNADGLTRMLMPHKIAAKSNRSHSIPSSSSSSIVTQNNQSDPQSNSVPNSVNVESGSRTTVGARKKAQNAVRWSTAKGENISHMNLPKTKYQSFLNINDSTMPPADMKANQQPLATIPAHHIPKAPPLQAGASRSSNQPANDTNPVLYLYSINGTFDRKTIYVPFHPETLRIGRQTNAKTAPTPNNGYFDSKVLSRQHAEIWADREGRIWIRDVKSSNGTFINGTRLSAENQDSEPHELQSQDILELGIDIVGEDQKTVVHRKVASKVEYAGYPGSASNLLEMNFGEFDPSHGLVMIPSQSSVQMRGRMDSQATNGICNRLVRPIYADEGQTSLVTDIEEYEMKLAQLQNGELERTHNFLGSLLSEQNLKDTSDPSTALANKLVPPSNGGFRSELKLRYSEPPAPPPRQPLPEKPDFARNNDSSQSLKRKEADRMRPMYHARPEQIGQIGKLAEALSSAKKEIDLQSLKLRDLEEMLQRERQARQRAEEVAIQMELRSESNNENFLTEAEINTSVDDVFELRSKPKMSRDKGPSKSSNSNAMEPHEVDESKLILEKRLELLLGDMQDLKNRMEFYKRRAETAESVRDANRKSLAVMVEKIRLDEILKNPVSAETSLAGKDCTSSNCDTKLKGLSDDSTNISNQVSDVLTQNGVITDKSAYRSPNTDIVPAVETIAKSYGCRDSLLYHTAPYASMLGVVILGVGIMAYLNGWQPPKIDQ